MFKDRLSKWGLSKNLKEPEAIAIARKYQQGPLLGKRAVYRVNGREITLRRVITYLARKGLSIDDVVAKRLPAMALPSVECCTPVPLPPRTPHCVDPLEIVVRSLRDYCRGMFDSKVWLKDYEGLGLVNGVATTARKCQNSLIHSLDVAWKFFQVGDPKQAWRAAHVGFANIENIVRAEHPSTLSFLSWLLSREFFSNMPEIRSLLLKQLSDMVEVVFSVGHPLHQAFYHLLRIRTNQILDAILTSHQSIRDSFESILGPTHSLTIFHRMESLKISGTLRSGGSKIVSLRKMLEWCESTRGARDLLTLTMRFTLGTLLARNNNEAGAIDCFERCLDGLLTTQGRQELHFNALTWLAFVHYKRGEHLRAMTCLDDAYNISVTHRGLSSPQTIQVLFRKERYLRGSGDAVSASRVREEWTRLQNSMVEIL